MPKTYFIQVFGICYSGTEEIQKIIGIWGR